MQDSTVPQPFVKWAGGKSQLVEQLGWLFPRKFNCYYEPFLGGGAVFFKLRPSKAVISDANYELINTYKVIKHDFAMLLAELGNIRRHPLTSSLYESYRKMNPQSLNRSKRAARFIFLNKTCYNGLYRVNRYGAFNVPFGKYDHMPKLYDEENMKQISRLLRTARIMCSDFETALKNAEDGDFVYLDPPYIPEPESTGFTSYTKEPFSIADQDRLAKVFRSLVKHGCLVMLSHSATRRVANLYKDFSETTYAFTADRMINCIGSRRTGFKEVVILSYNPPLQTLAQWFTR